MATGRKKFKAAFGHLMGVVGKAIRLRLEKNLAEAGYDLLAVHMILLKHIDLKEGANQQTLTDQMGLDKASMTRFLDALETRHLVTRVHDKTDRRRNMIYLTTRGKQLIEPIGRVAVKTEREALQSIDPEQVRICKEVLQRVRENLEG